MDKGFSENVIMRVLEMQTLAMVKERTLAEKENAEAQLRLLQFQSQGRPSSAEGHATAAMHQYVSHGSSGIQLYGDAALRRQPGMVMKTATKKDETREMILRTNPFFWKKDYKGLNNLMGRVVAGVIKDTNSRLLLSDEEKKEVFFKHPDVQAHCRAYDQDGGAFEQFWHWKSEKDSCDARMGGLEAYNHKLTQQLGQVSTNAVRAS